MSSLAKTTAVANTHRVMAFINQAGGSCKTTTAAAFAGLAAEAGLRVLLIDLDSQCNASKICGYEWLPGVGRPYLYDLAEDHPDLKANLDRRTVFEVLAGEKVPDGPGKQKKLDVPMERAIFPARYRVSPDLNDHSPEAFAPVPNLDIVLGSELMADAVEEIAKQEMGGFWLRRKLKPLIDANQYDLYLVDCPAALDRGLSAVMVAAPEIIGCVTPGGKEMEALVKASFSMEAVRNIYDGHDVFPELVGIIVGRVHKKKDGTVNRFKGGAAAKRVSDLEEAYGSVVKGMIREDVRVGEAYDQQITLSQYDPTSEVVADYRAAAVSLGIVAA
ncbi:ParA family protein [Streptacidiphilus sp. EB103A]|uniref:ParA family protein n=1 Tax=Streptacidiphilus sp. EB103A TaxID=3156275 RepID=UPI0035190FCB